MDLHLMTAAVTITIVDTLVVVMELAEVVVDAVTEDEALATVIPIAACPETMAVTVLLVTRAAEEADLLMVIVVVLIRSPASLEDRNVTFQSIRN